MKLKKTPTQVQKIEQKKEFDIKQLIKDQCIGMAGDILELYKQKKK